MGWKAACVFVCETDTPFLAGYPANDSYAARDVVERVGLAEDFEFAEASTLEFGMYPEADQLFVGAYPGGAVLCRWELLEPLLDRPDSEDTRRFVEAFPGAQILVLSLHSVTTYAAWAVYEGGECLRLRASADGEVMQDLGDPLPEEVPLWERAVERNGQFFWEEEFEGEPYELDEISMGEEFVFEVSRRVFGCRLDYYDIWELPMDEYKQKRKGLFSWLFGG